MLLVIDVGNTNTVMGIYEGTTLTAHWRLETKKERTADELGIFFKELLEFSKIALTDISNIAISNVVPPLMFTLQQMCKRFFGKKPFVVDHKTTGPLSLKLDNPKELGADRIVNAVAAFEEFKTDLVVIDFGTATTFDVVTKAGDYLGGAICPGIKISLEALFHSASKLPRIEITQPENAIGHNTVDCMQSGVYFGYIGLVDSLVKKMELELGCPLKVIATGGLAGLIAEGSETIHVVDELLTLKGLKSLHARHGSV